MYEIEDKSNIFCKWTEDKIFQKEYFPRIMTTWIKAEADIFNHVYIHFQFWKSGQVGAAAEGSFIHCLFLDKIFGQRGLNLLQNRCFILPLYLCMYLLLKCIIPPIHFSFLYCLQPQLTEQ